MKTEEVAAAAITDEDLALDRELERMAREEVIPDVDASPVPEMRREVEEYTLLSSVVDVKPASTINELIDQVHQAKMHDCDSIEASPAIIRHYCRNNYPDKVGYFIFQDIKVYIPGFFEASKKRETQTIEERVFGNSKVTIASTPELKR